MLFCGLSDILLPMTTTKLTPEVIVADGVSIPYTLKARDRSDCCSVEPLFRVKIRGDLPELLFCGHHFTKNEPELSNIAVSIVDESDKIVTNRLIGSEN